MYAPLAENESPPSAGGRAGVACARRAPTNQHSTLDEDLADRDDHLRIFRELDSDDILHSNWETGLVLITVHLGPDAQTCAPEVGLVSSKRKDLGPDG